MVSTATVRELVRVLGDPKFRLSQQYRMEALALYLLYCESLLPTEECPVHCRDVEDQALPALARSAKADLLVTGDTDLLALAGQTSFVVETPEAYRRRFAL